MDQETKRSWTTLWDRQNRRVLLLASQRGGGPGWSDVRHDPTVSVPGIYDIWRIEDRDGDTVGDIVFVEIQLDERDEPLGFPDELLSKHLLGSPTLQNKPRWPSGFIWWHDLS